MRFFSFVLLPFLLLPLLTACVSEKPLNSLEGLKTAQIIIAAKTSVTPNQLAQTIRTCWLEKDELFEGFKVAQQGNTIVLNGPIAGNPPQRFLIMFNVFKNEENAQITIDYPKGSNYQFVRSRLKSNLKKLETGKKPC